MHRQRLIQPSLYLIVSLALLLGLPFTTTACAFEDQVQSISAELAAEIAEEGKSTVAVVDFTDLQGNVTALGRFLAEEFSVALASAEQDFQVIDRTHLASIIREHQLSQTGLIDPQTARELGKITGVEALVTGTLTPFGDSVRVTVKLLDTESARLIASTAGRIPTTQAIGELLEVDLSRADAAAASGSMHEGRESQPRKAQPTGSANAVQVQEANRVRFELRSCKLSSQQLTCEMLIENKENDRNIRISDRTRIFDPSGNEHQVSSIVIAGRRTKDQDILKGIPVTLKLSFNSIDPSSSYLPILDIRLHLTDIGWVQLQFRDVPISR